MRIALAVVVIFLMAGCSVAASTTPGSPAASGTALSSPSPSTTASPSPSPLPSGGISEERAIAIARGRTGDAKTLASATVGRFGDLRLDPARHPAASPEPSHLVWAVTFTGEFVICPPFAAPSGGSTPAPQECWSPRPGTSVVYLDYRTGDWLTTESMAPAP